MEKILLNRVHLENSRSIDVYMEHEGYEGLKKALAMSPKEVIAEVKRSNLRGRGGAGFPAAMKWGFAAADPKKPKYLLCNADEGEPGTCKDRQIMEGDPHELLEGMAIAGYAFGAEYGYIYLRAEYPKVVSILETAIAEAEARGCLGANILGSDFSFTLRVHRGAGAYICGEETALIESLEGKRGQSRIKPPFPVNVGVFGLPTVVNNVETLANVSHIMLKGGAWFAGVGSENCPGTRIVSLSGHVNKPGYYELPMGVTFREVIYEHGGGIRGGRKLKAFIPGGASASCLVPEHLEVKMDYDEVAAAGSMLGSSALMVMDDTTCMVKVAARLMRFFVHESCGKCTPCREGTEWLLRLLQRIEAGEGKLSDTDLLRELCDHISGKTFCPLGEGALGPVRGTLKHFEDEYRAHIEQKCCPLKESNVRQ
jgi:NADH-quinone oxidoreductase subunit F